MIAGQEVAIGSDGSFEYLWTLAEGVNVIEVIAETSDSKIAKVDLTLNYTAPPPLTLTIDSPQDGTIINQSTVQISGTVSDSSASVTVNGIVAQLIGNTFQAEVALTEGVNTITAIANDLYGRSVSQSISLSAITKGSVGGTVQNSLGQALADVTVTVQDGGGTSLAAVTAADGSFLVSAVTQGDVSVTFEKNGYITAIENVTVTAGETLIVNAQLANIPSLGIDIVSPLDGETVMVTPVTVSGNISNSLATVTVNGVTAAVANNTYQANVELMEGLNTLTAVATDPYGQSASASITLTLMTQGSISGKVTARSTELPLEGAAVSVTDSNGTQQSVSTDANGDFLINHIAGGAFNCTVSYTGYVTDSFSGNLIPGETLTINSVLSLSPPLIGNIEVIPAMDGAVITWTTDQAADSLVEYGETTSYGQSVSESSLLTNHSLTLTGLSQATTYHFKVASANSDGSVAQSGDATFTILALPVISNISVSNITGNSATITWTTDLPADSFVEYGESAAYGLTAGDTALSTEHHVDLVGLFSGRTYHFRVSSTSSQGAQAVSADDQFDTLQMFELIISEPLDGTTVSRSDILVKGTFTTFSGQETGIVANNIPALVNGNEFAANHVELEEGENVILIKATDINGNILEQSITVTVQSAQNSIRVIPLLESGIDPLETTLRIDGNFTFATLPTLSYVGPGPVEYLTSTEPDTFNVRMTTPGFYSFTAEVLDDQGGVYTDTVIVSVVDKVQLDALLQAKWQGMKTALSLQNIEGGLGFFTEESVSRYREIMNVISGELPQIISAMQGIEIIYSVNGTTKYRINRVHDINGTPVTITYYIYFAIDNGGLWKINQF